MRKLKLIGSAIVLFATTVFMSACLDTDPPFDHYGQWVKDVAAIDAYIATNGISVIKDAGTGISIHIIELGTDGLPPNLSNDLKVNYVGRLLSGEVFDPGTNPYLCKLTGCNVGGQVPIYIQGWQVGLAMLPAGSKATLYIPSYYAYGTGGSDRIPKNSPLIFDIELESVVRTDNQKSRFTADTTAIKTYINNVDNGVTNAVRYDSGIWYTITNEGLGAAPNSIYQPVKIRYTVKEMVKVGTTYLDAVLIEPRPDFSSRLVNLPQGVMIGLQLMKEGEKRTFYVPSVLAYGPSGFSNGIVNIPANANLIIEIELLEVVN